MNDDLPASAGTPATPIASGPTSGSMSTNKEVVTTGGVVPESAAYKEAGQESVDTLPKEVASAGVTIHPTSIPIPPPVVKMGVRPAGANVPAPAAAITLPITDEQIAQGLGKSMKLSIRWLAEWCVRRLKQVHVGLQSIRGKLTRVQTH